MATTPTALEIDSSGEIRARSIYIAFLSLGAILPVLLIIASAIFFRWWRKKKRKMKDNRHELDLDDFEEIQTLPRTPTIRIINSKDRKNSLKRTQSQEENEMQFLEVDNFGYQAHENQFEVYVPKKPARQKTLAKRESEEKRLSVISENPDENSYFEINQIDKTSFNSKKDKIKTDTLGNIANTHQPLSALNLAKENNLNVDGLNLSEDQSITNEYAYNLMEGGIQFDNRKTSVKSSLLQIVNSPPNLQTDSIEEDDEDNDKENEYFSHAYIDNVENKRSRFIQSHQREFPRNEVKPERLNLQKSIYNENQGANLNLEHLNSDLPSVERLTNQNNRQSTLTYNNDPKQRYSSYTDFKDFTSYENFISSPEIPLSRLSSPSVSPPIKPSFNFYENSSNFGVKNSSKNVLEKDFSSNQSYKEHFQSSPNSFYHNLKNKYSEKNEMRKPNDSKYSYNGAIEILISKPSNKLTNTYDSNHGTNSKVLQSYGYEETDVKINPYESVSASKNFDQGYYDVMKSPRKDLNSYSDEGMDKEISSGYEKDTFYISKNSENFEKYSIIDMSSEKLSDSYTEPYTKKDIPVRYDGFNSRNLYLQNISNNKNNNNNNNSNTKYTDDDIKGLEEWRKGRRRNEVLSLQQDPRYELNRLNHQEKKRLQIKLEDVPNYEKSKKYYRDDTRFDDEHTNISYTKDLSQNIVTTYNQSDKVPSNTTNNSYSKTSSSHLKREEKEVLKIFDDIYKEEGLSSGSERPSSSDEYRGNYLFRAAKQPPSVHYTPTKQPIESSKSTLNKAQHNSPNSRYNSSTKNSPSHNPYNTEKSIKKSPASNRFSAHSPPRDQLKSIRNIENIHQNSDNMYTNPPKNKPYNPPKSRYNQSIPSSHTSTFEQLTNNNKYDSNSNTSSTPRPYSHLLSDDYPYRRRILLQNSSQGRSTNSHINFSRDANNLPENKNIYLNNNDVNSDIAFQSSRLTKY